VNIGLALLGVLAVLAAITSSVWVLCTAGVLAVVLFEVNRWQRKWRI